MEFSHRMLSMLGQSGSIFGMTLPEMARSDNNIMVLSSDMSTPVGLDKFKTEFPERFINMGVAESNMAGAAAGLADEGFRTICVAQACFITMRCYEQIRQYAGYMQIPQIYVGFGSGFSLSYMGNTHYAIEDIALMKTVPTLTIIAPCDAMEATLAFQSVVENGLSAYIRLSGGPGAPAVYTDKCDFTIGNAIYLRDGKDVQIIATGSMVGRALAAADILSESGISASVIDMHTVAPLDTDAIDLSKKLVVTVEEHRTWGGLGTSVSDYLSKKACHPRLLKIGVGMDYPHVGSYEYIMTQCGLDSNSIASKIIKEIQNT